MPRYKINYKEGNYFSLPLRTDGYGIGVVYRKARGSIIVAGFFGIKTSELPSLDDVKDISLDQIVLITLVGHLGLVSEEWKVFGSVANWKREHWPMPKLVQPTSNTLETAKLFTFDENNFNYVTNVEIIPISETKNYYADSVKGYGAAEIAVTRLVDNDKY